MKERVGRIAIRLAIALLVAEASYLRAQTSPKCDPFPKYEEFILRLPPSLLPKNAKACGKEGVESGAKLGPLLGSLGIALGSLRVVSGERGLIVVRTIGPRDPEQFEQLLNQLLPQQLPPSALESLQGRRSEPNYKVVANECDSVPPWGFDATTEAGVVAGVDAENVWKVEWDKKPVLIAVVDSGLDESIGDFDGRRAKGWDFLSGKSGTVPHTSHGTHVAGIIGANGTTATSVIGIDPLATILPIGFINEKGEGTLAAAICAVELAIVEKARIVNMSWELCGESAFLRDLMESSKDVLFISSAGNRIVNLDSDARFPASYGLPNQIVVAASTIDGSLWKGSNRGKESVSVAAPGYCITSLVPGGATDAYTGTSMAAPFVSGAASIMMRARPALSPARTRCLIESTARELPALAGHVSTGGLLDVRSAVAAATKDTICPGDQDGQPQ